MNNDHMILSLFKGGWTQNSSDVYLNQSGMVPDQGKSSGSNQTLILNISKKNHHFLSKFVYSFS